MDLKIPDNKLYRFLMLSGVVIVLAFLLISFSKDYFSSPSVGVITSGKSTDNKSNTTMAVEAKTFSFSYSSVFQPIKSSGLSSGDVEKFSFVAYESSPWNLTIQIRKLPTGKVADDGSYNLRKTNPSTYTESRTKAGPNDVYIMTSNTGGYNKVAFIVHEKIDANITLISSSSVDAEKIDAALNQILTTWKWL